MTIDDLSELKRFPKLIKKVTEAATSSRKELRLDLGEFIPNHPFALVELLLFASTLGVTLILLPEILP